MKETSTTIRSGAYGSWSAVTARALTRSITVTRSILAQAVVELAVGDVQGDHVGRSALEQAVGEAAGGRADVERAAAGDGEPERVERVGELDPAAGDVGRRAVDGQLDRGVDHLPGLLRAAVARIEETCPAITAAAARVRDSNRPRSASRESRRTRGTPGNGTQGPRANGRCET